MEAYNPFYESATLHMVAQLEYLEELIGRPLNPAEKDNIHEFYYSLSSDLQIKFEDQCGPLL